MAEGIIAIGQFGIGGTNISRFDLRLFSLSQFSITFLALAQIAFPYSVIAQITVVVDSGYGHMIFKLVDILKKLWWSVI